MLIKIGGEERFPVVTEGDFFQSIVFLEEQPDMSFAYTVYPNPTNGHLNVQLTEGTLKANMQLIDLSGNVVMQQQLEAFTQLDLLSLQHGMYVMYLEIEGRVYTTKVILD